MKPSQFRLKKQQGLSIISLLIGLLISVLCILGSLTLYKNLVHVATDTKVGAGFDGQLASAMLTAQMEVQNAGFGLANVVATDLVRLDGDNELELRWRYNVNGVFFCRGLKETLMVPGDGLSQRVLRLTQLNAGCNANNDLTPAAGWQNVATLAQWPIVANVAAYLAAQNAGDRTLLNFNLAQGACSPYGTSAMQNHRILQVTAPSSASLNGAALPLSTYTFCLPNT